jgi:uncharacterized RDD family membrane protein YckC
MSFGTIVYKPNLKKRILATVLDYGLYCLFFLAYVLYFGHDNTDGGKTVDGIRAVPVFIVWLLYFAGIEGAWGATPGHKLLDLRVVSVGPGPVRFVQALKRHLLDPFDIFFWGIPGIIAIKNTEKHQRLGDLWAKTIVVDTKDSEQNLAH